MCLSTAYNFTSYMYVKQHDIYIETYIYIYSKTSSLKFCGAHTPTKQPSQPLNQSHTQNTSTVHANNTCPPTAHLAHIRIQ